MLRLVSDSSFYRFAPMDMAPGRSIVLWFQGLWTRVDVRLTTASLRAHGCCGQSIVWRLSWMFV